MIPQQPDFSKAVSAAIASATFTPVAPPADTSEDHPTATATVTLGGIEYPATRYASGKTAVTITEKKDIPTRL